MTRDYTVDTANSPWIPMGPAGLSFKPLRFYRDGRGWMYLFRVEPGTVIPRHRHTGEVHGFTLSGRRELLDTGEVVGPGGYVYEPAGNVDSWRVVGDEPAVFHITVMGSIQYLDAEGRVTREATPADRLVSYRRWCEEQGVPFAATLE
ncbi:2,4'-dihydroxyacetophenone dioxygenase family protein [Myxococcus sp. K15C18031901]|uniref:2,4'-dihydroxyacetophenone dioxygenase family protein n=1 Tax=Myxococcus dinghuensis TaxID=2906761 RepID=UPI0020A7FCDB|nr:2,4'-dihydroxyacetophenone dioxygenase family protein [Myxococcus dinghuensis]MCP3097378.1 2,4'-dihydroxyacetophenone dioxygenase family protein [Myxococcus dinghuensis]